MSHDWLHHWAGFYEYIFHTSKSGDFFEPRGNIERAFFKLVLTRISEGILPLRNQYVCQKLGRAPKPKFSPLLGACFLRNRTSFHLGISYWEKSRCRETCGPNLGLFTGKFWVVLSMRPSACRCRKASSRSHAARLRISLLGVLA